jgi:uncharacterized Fe-S cluster-containing radical SAM superfamily protein
MGVKGAPKIFPLSSIADSQTFEMSQLAALLLLLTSECSMFKAFSTDFRTEQGEIRIRTAKSTAAVTLSEISLTEERMLKDSKI